MTPEQESLNALIRHGYNPESLPSGASARKGREPTETWPGFGGEILRYHVCYLDGIEIDGHEFSDLDPGSNCCLHCDYDLDDDDRSWQWRQLVAWIAQAGPDANNVLQVRAKMRELDPTLNGKEG